MKPCTHRYTHTCSFSLFPLGIADVTEKTWPDVAGWGLQSHAFTYPHIDTCTLTSIHCAGSEQMDKIGRMWPEEWCMTGTAVVSSLHSRYTVQAQPPYTSSRADYHSKTQRQTFKRPGTQTLKKNSHCIFHNKWKNLYHLCILLLMSCSSFKLSWKTTATVQIKHLVRDGYGNFD